MRRLILFRVLDLRDDLPYPRHSRRKYTTIKDKWRGLEISTFCLFGINPYSLYQSGGGDGGSGAVCVRKRGKERERVYFVLP